MEGQSRYLVGIDLGTTNSALSYVDTHEDVPTVRLLAIPQLTDRGFVEARSALPSFCYLTIAREWPPEDNRLPWAHSTDHVVGELAKEQGALVPTRLVASAKSWLCNAAADRKERILPPSAEEFLRISPVEATRRYLSHLRDAWNYAMAKGDPLADLEQQEIVLTVPASFDEVARSLTALAAQQAGFTRVTLLEEPQAAFYEWIRVHEKTWSAELTDGQLILVCDVGGGTTDFSLIEVTTRDGMLGFQRLAVGDHLLLGGDNMDAYIAHFIASRLKVLGTEELTPLQWQQLRHEARKAKEALLSDQNPLASYIVRLQAAGSRVVAGSASLELHADEVRSLLVEGFFGAYERQDAISLRQRSGMRSMGLPYEDEPSVTKHLAHFLFCQGSGAEGRAPGYVLFNGGSMKPQVFQGAIVESIARWYGAAAPKVLKNASLDLSVSKGAAYYGRSRRGQGVRIGGGIPRSYYLKVEVQGSSTPKALTLLPRGSEEGASFEPTQVFSLLPNVPVSFQLLTSHVRLHDHQGELIDIIEEEMQPLPPLNTVIRFGKGAVDAERLPVRLGLSLTPVGTLAIWLSSTKTAHRWNLDFQVRHASGQEDSLSILAKARQDESHDIAYVKETQNIVESVFDGVSAVLPDKMMDVLEQTLQRSRKEWPPSVLRALADTLLDLAPKRKRSLTLEQRWWNLLGFCLRPGLGYPLDDFRIERVWKLLLAEPKNGGDADVEIQRLICLRRLAGGLSKGQQMQLAGALMLVLFDKPKVIRGADRNRYVEQIRVLAAMEKIENKSKQRLAELLLDRITSAQAVDADYWALGRLGARQLLFGTIANVIPAELCKRWLERLLALPNVNLEWLAFPMAQMARRTNHPELNVPESVASLVSEKFAGSSAATRFHNLMTKTFDDRAQQEAAFGESLPSGLFLEIQSNSD